MSPSNLSSHGLPLAELAGKTLPLRFGVATRTMHRVFKNIRITEGNPTHHQEQHRGFRGAYWDDSTRSIGARGSEEIPLCIEHVDGLCKTLCSGEMMSPSVPATCGCNARPPPRTNCATALHSLSHRRAVDRQLRVRVGFPWIVLPRDVYFAV